MGGVVQDGCETRRDRRGRRTPPPERRPSGGVDDDDVAPIYRLALPRKYVFSRVCFLGI